MVFGNYFSQGLLKDFFDKSKKLKKIFLYWVSQKCCQRVYTKFFEKKTFHRGIRDLIPPSPYRVNAMDRLIGRLGKLQIQLNGF